MEYRRLGRAGVKVSRLCLGTAFRGYWHRQTDEATAIRTVETAIDLGINFIDSANYYYLGRCVELLGKAIKGKREDLVITTKVWSQIGDGPNDRGLSRFAIMREIERSLKRLQTDYIDIYLLHHWDPDTELDETLKAFDDLVRQDKVRYVGASNFTAAQVVEALWTADRGGLDPLFVLQNQFNILQRWEIEPELLPLCRQYGLGMMTFSPLAVGLLSGRFRRGQKPPADGIWADDAKFEAAFDEKSDQIVETLIEIGQAQGRTPAQVAIAWILANEDVTAPIIGPDRPEHVEEVQGALEVKFSAEELQVLDQLSQWEPLKRTH